MYFVYEKKKWQKVVQYWTAHQKIEVIKKLSFFKEIKGKNHCLQKKNAGLALFLFQNINNFCLD